MVVADRDAGTAQRVPEDLLRVGLLRAHAAIGRREDEVAGTLERGLQEWLRGGATGSTSA
jgi:hypothetical protein